MIGRRGVEAQLEIELWPKELSALQHSGQVLRETIDLVLKTNPTAGKGGAMLAGPKPAPSQPSSPVRVTMGGGGGGNGFGSGPKGKVTISGQGGRS